MPATESDNKNEPTNANEANQRKAEGSEEEKKRERESALILTTTDEKERDPTHWNPGRIEGRPLLYRRHGGPALPSSHPNRLRIQPPPERKMRPAGEKEEERKEIRIKV